MIRRIRRTITRQRTETAARLAYQAYAARRKNPLPYNQWLAAQAKAAEKANKHAQEETPAQPK